MTHISSVTFCAILLAVSSARPPKVLGGGVARVHEEITLGFEIPKAIIRKLVEEASHEPK